VHIITNPELKNCILAFVSQRSTEDTFSEQLLEITVRLNEGIIHGQNINCGNHWGLLKPKDLAKNLCLIGHRLLRRIPLTNLIDGQYTRATDESNPSPLNEFSKWFNIESNWAASSIILASSAPECSSLIQMFISVIANCIKFHNFSSAMAIYSGLNFGAVQRLTTAWSLVAPKSVKKMAEFDKLFSFKMNFGAYREILRNTQLPCIPLFTVIGRDLTHLEEASPKFIKEEDVTKVNFERLSEVAVHLIFFRNCQLIRFDFEEKPSFALEKQLRDIKLLQKETLYQISDETEAKHAEEQAIKKKKKPSFRDMRDFARSASNASSSPGNNAGSIMKPSTPRKNSRAKKKSSEHLTVSGHKSPSSDILEPQTSPSGQTSDT